MDTIKQLLYLYKQQTNEEQACLKTLEKNDRGFNGVDSGFCSSVAEWILGGKPLTVNQLSALKKILPKYSKQLSNDIWKQEAVPESALLILERKAEEKKQPDTLDLDPGGGGLVFIPATYPSKQIRDLGSFYWTGKSWMQTKANVSAALVKDICKMFPKTVVTPRLQEELVPKTISLSEELNNHGTLFSFQKEAIQFMVANKKALLGLAPGLGKTACAIFAAKEVKASRILVISPLSLMYNWQNEIKKWIGEDADIVYKENCPFIPKRWTLTNYDTLRLHSSTFMRRSFDCIIVDETIMIKNRKAMRTQTIKSLVKCNQPEFLWFLSGAPVSRLYDDMFSQLNILSPLRFTSYWKFAEKYCHVQQNQWGWQIVANKPNAATELQSDLSDIYFSRTQDQVLDLPEWIFDNLHVRMDSEQDSLYREMENLFITSLEDGSKLLAPNVLAQLLRLIQLASNPILVGGKNIGAKWLIVEELLEYEELPAIVWTSFVKTAELLNEQLSKKFKVGVLTGQTNSSDRQKIVDDFQAGKLDVIIAHPGVGKFGFTLTAARTAIYLERSYNGDDYYQSLHRVRRIGTAKSPHIIHLISDRADGSSTVDNVIDKILSSRKENVLKLTQGELKTMFEGE
jgi:SNF2 family DNA or RNA helicase